MSIPSEELLQDLKRQEGFRTAPYLCPAGCVTIGYGHNLEADPEPIRKWSPELADAVLGKSGSGTVRSIRHKELLNILREYNMCCTAAEAEQWLLRDVFYAAQALSERCPAYRHLVNKCGNAYPSGSLGTGSSDLESTGIAEAEAALVRVDVLINMAFNLGVEGLLKFRRTLDFICADKYQEAASAMMESRWAQQVGRRAVELARQMRSGKRG